jgi:hypothetical protein
MCQGTAAGRGEPANRCWGLGGAPTRQRYAADAAVQNCGRGVKIKEAFGCATVYAHHPGKAEGNFSRGHSSLQGDPDVVAAFSGKSGTRTIEIKKQKDDEDGTVIGYSLRQVRLGRHTKTGEPVTTCVVDWVEGKSVKSPSRPWPKALTLLHDIITTTAIEAGFDHRPNGDGPLVRAVSLNDVRRRHKKQFVGIGDGDCNARERTAFSRNLGTARNNHLIGGELIAGKEMIWAAR